MELFLNYGECSIEKKFSWKEKTGTKSFLREELEDKLINVPGVQEWGQTMPRFKVSKLKEGLRRFLVYILNHEATPVSWKEELKEEKAAQKMEELQEEKTPQEIFIPERKVEEEPVVVLAEGLEEELPAEYSSPMCWAISNAFKQTDLDPARGMRSFYYEVA